ncbi:MAG: NADH-quinone oxidoreductase subunit C [Planctomycetota bacterium]
MSETPNTGIAHILEKHGDAVVSQGEYAGQPWVTVKPEAIVAIATGLRDEAGFDMLEDMTAVDYLDRPDVEGRFRVVYHFLSLERAEMVRVKVFVEDEDVEVPTLSEVYGVANWLEREVFDMFGIVFADHPNLTRIMMSLDFEGFPCRRDFPVRGRIPITDPMREDDFARGVAGEFVE